MTALSYSPQGERAEDALHHSQMLTVVVSLKQGEAGVELEDDAPDAPDVARVAPPQFYK